MTDSAVEMLNTAARALRGVFTETGFEPRNYRDIGGTITAIADAFEAEADALTRTEPDLPDLPDMPERELLEALIHQADAEPPADTWKGEQFNPANYFSEPESDTATAWATAMREGIVRAQQMSPIEMDSYFEFVLFSYGLRRQRALRREFATETSNLRIDVPAGESPLEVAIGVRDEIARRLRNGKL